MTTTRLFSDQNRFASLLRSSLKQQIPFAIVSLIVFGMIILMAYFIQFSTFPWHELTTDAQISAHFVRYGYFADGVYMDEGLAVLAMTALIGFSFIMALVQNAYLHSKKMTDFYHSLPIKRPHLFGVNFLSSAATILVPYLAVVLVTMAVQLIQYGQYMPDVSGYLLCIVQDILCAVLVVFVVFAFTSFVAVNVGTVFDAFALALVLGMTPMAIYLVAVGMWTTLTYGAMFEYDYILSLSPFTFVFQRFVQNTYVPELQQYISEFPTMVFLIWAVIGLLLLGAAVLCYNRRRSEVAEQTQPQGVFQTITKCVGAFCGGALFFFIFYAARIGFAGGLVAILAGAVLIGLIVEMILSRGIRSIRKNLKWLVLSGVACCLVMVSVEYDLFGRYAYVPEVDDVASVQMNYRGRFERLSQSDVGYINVGYINGIVNIHYEDAETIAAVTQAHQLAVNNPPPDDLEYSSIEDSDFSYQDLRVNYHLNNGQTVSRVYSITHEDVSRKLTELDTMDEFTQKNHNIFQFDNEEDGYDFIISNISVSDALGSNTTIKTLEQPDMDRLLEAARTDMLAETWEGITNPTAPAYGYLRFNYDLIHEAWDEWMVDVRNEQRYTANVILTEEYTNTIKVLKDLGLYDEEAFALPTADDVASVAISAESHGYSGGDWLMNIILDESQDPSRSRELYADYNDRYYVKTTDPAMIQEVLTKGRSQMGCTDNTPLGFDVFAASMFDKEGRLLGTLLISWDDLTKEVQQGLVERYEAMQTDEFTEVTVAAADVISPTVVAEPVLKEVSIAAEEEISAEESPAAEEESSAEESSQAETQE